MENIKALKVLSNKEMIIYDLYQENLIQSAKIVLETQFNLKVLQFIASRNKSHVIATAEDIAVKIIPKGKITDGFIRIWPYVQHKNILPLLSYDLVPQLDAYLMLSPLHPYNLDDILESEVFLKDENAVHMVRKWISEVTSTLSYLHGKSICHLGIKSSNVLISSDLSAVVCDFRTANASVSTNFIYDVTSSDMAPELNESSNRLPKVQIEGIPFDIWSLGMLTLNIFSQKNVQKKITCKSPCWHKQIYPTVFSTIKNHHFLKRIGRAFPACEVDEELEEIVRNFITTCLAVRPDERLSAVELMGHRFLDEMGFLEQPKQEWVKKVASSSIQKKVHLYLNQKSSGTLSSNYSPDKMIRFCCKDLQSIRQDRKNPFIKVFRNSDRTKNEEENAKRTTRNRYINRNTLMFKSVIASLRNFRNKLKNGMNKIIKKC